MGMSQKAGVFMAVCAVLGQDEFEGAVKPSKEERAKIIELVTDGIIAKEIEFSTEATAKYDTKDKVKGYVNGMVSNWLRKDLRLNGGEAYETKNPGSRAGQGDEVLKNLKALKETLSDKAHKDAVDVEIKKRSEEIAAAKAKTVVIDESKIPEALRHLLNKSA